METKELTEERKNIYVQAGGPRCPYCDSSNIEAQNPDFEGNRVIETVSCNACHKQWLDIYTLTEIQEL